MRWTRIMEREWTGCKKEKKPRGDQPPETFRGGLAVVDADAIATRAAVQEHTFIHTTLCSFCQGRTRKGGRRTGLPPFQPL